MRSRATLGWRGFGGGAALACVLALCAAQGSAATIRQQGGTVRIPAPRQPTNQPGGPAEAPTAAGTAAAPAAPAAPTIPPKISIVREPGGATMMEMEFYGLDIDHLLKELSLAAGVTIVKSDQVTGPVTVIAPGKVPLDVAFQIVNSVLEVRGFTMVRAPTGIYKVIPISEALQSSLPMGFGSNPEDVATTDEMITQVIPLKYLSATDVAQEIQGLLSQQANVVPTSTNWLIVTDTAANIQRVLTYVSDAESQLSGGLRVFPLQYYDATEMATLVYSTILTGQAARRGTTPAWERRVVPARPGGAAQQQQQQRATATAATGVQGQGPEFCYPVTRTNSLIVRATPEHIQQVKDLIDALDRPISLRDAYFVYPVKNLLASDLANLIGPLVGATVTAGTGAGAATTAAGATTQAGRTATSTRAATTRSQGVSGIMGRSAETGRTVVPGRAVTGSAGYEVKPLAGAAEGSSAQGVAVAQAPEVGVGPVQVAPNPALPPPEVGGVPEFVPGGQEAPGGFQVTEVPAGVGVSATIAADDNTNTLLISAPPETMELIRQLLDQLDVMPPQVYIQAIIAEVTLTRDNTFGFQWSGLPTLGSYEGTPIANLSIDLGLVTRDSQGNVTRPLGMFGEITADQLQGVMTALAKDSHARILSTPAIFTANNQLAQITVSSSRPFPTGTLTTPTGTGTTITSVISTSVRYEPVGILLQVTPRVTQGDLVRMDVLVTADDVGSTVTVGGQEFPTTLTRQASATANVKSGNTVVLGGLMRDSIRRSATRVPLLGDLPLIGSFFRNTTSQREKSELLVFLTPRVLRSPAELQQFTDERKAKMLEVPKSLQGPSGTEKPPAK